MLKDKILNTIQENSLIKHLITYLVKEDNEETDIAEIANFVASDNKIIVGSNNKVFIANIN